MKKVLFFAGIAGLLAACDYSVKSNGNIDEAYAHESTHQIMHEPSTEHESAAPHTVHKVEHTVKHMLSDSTIVKDSVHTDSTKHLEEAHH